LPQGLELFVSPVKAMAITLVHHDDFDKVRREGTAGGARLAAELKRCRHRHISDLRRKPVW